MKLTKPADSVPKPFIPGNPFGKQMQRLFLNEKSSDIMFEVGGEEKSKDMTVAKTAPVTFPANRCIVANCSSIFAELCESNDDDRTTPIQITGVSPDVFRILLKEAVMDYFVENHADVIEKLTTNALIPGSLIKDVLETVFRGEKKDRISELRKKAHHFSYVQGLLFP